jgi:hypothetical protein
MSYALRTSVAAQPTTQEIDPTMEEAMTSLRSAAIEPDSTAELEINVMRAWRIERQHSPLRLWIPVLLCAVVSALAISGILKLFVDGSQSSMPVHQAEVERQAQPSLTGFTDQP